MKQSIILLIIILCRLSGATAQQKFNRYDYLHGKLTPMRTCFDVKHYNISVVVLPEKKFISGRNIITFLTVDEFKELQLDFSAEMKIDSIIYENKLLTFKRDSNATYVYFTHKVPKGSLEKLTVYFSGNPHIAKKAPWDGGFVWSKDSLGNDWVGLACEGTGASLWLPCKDHWSDEADSMDMYLTVPHYLVGVSNGQFIAEYSPARGYKTYHWKASYPINNYGISINIGDYLYLTDAYKSTNRKMDKDLLVSFFVLRYNKDRAKAHFKQVFTMLACYERFFDIYPFWNDGYKLVETPYWGMEHQSCIAYGNGYKNNKYNFDFIIIHESAHEWFANSITASDPADMWIHESFTTYAEALYVECTMGTEASQQYLNEQKPKIENKNPMIGPRDVYFHGRTDNDIYYKGTWMLHTMRNMIDDDSLWFSALEGFCNEFKMKIITTRDVLAYFNKATNRSWDAFFDQYLNHAQLPLLEYKVKMGTEGTIIVKYRWRNIVKGFNMPVKVTMTKDKWDFVTPTEGWQLIDLNFFEEKDFMIQTDKFLMATKKL